MRHVIGFALAGLGAFLIATALVLHTFLIGQLLKFPLNEYHASTLRAVGASYFSPTTLKEVSGATIVVTGTVKGDGPAGNSSTAVWNGFSYLYDVTNSAQVRIQTRRMAFDRRTGQLVSCCRASIDGNTAIHQSGLLGLVFPFGTQPKTYQVFDVNLLKPAPARYEGATMIDGIRVYRFVEHVPATQIGTQTLPGSLVGMNAASVTLPEYYTATNTYWVDPVTGGALDVTQDERLVLDDAAGAQRLVLFDADMIMTPQSVRSTVQLDQPGSRDIGLIRTTIPLASGLTGIAALIAGIILARKGRDDQPDHPDTAMPESAGDPVSVVAEPLRVDPAP